MSKENNYTIKEIILSLSIFLIFVFFLQILDKFFSIKEIILPSPLEVWQAGWDNMDYLFSESFITLFESVIGFLLGSFMAFFVAVLFTYFQKIKLVFYPYAIMLKALPLYALAPILVLWFGTGVFSKIVLSALVCFYPVLVGSVDGLGSINKDELALLKLMGASKWQEFKFLRLPKSLVFIFPALKVSTTLAVVGAVVAEFLGSSRGLGYLIVNASYYIETSLMFAGIINVSFIGLLFFSFISFLEKKILFWKK